MSDGDQLALPDFPSVQAQTYAPALADMHAEPLIVSPTIQPSATAAISGNEIPISPLPANGSLSMLTASGEVRPLEEMEIEIIRFAIAHYRGQMSEVARRLKIGRSTLYRKLDEAAADDTADSGNEP
jgi:DNA-binding NtrC family response regulator